MKISNTTCGPYTSNGTFRPESFILLSKSNKPTISEDSKRSCKVLKFSPEWKFDEVVAEIAKLNSRTYQNLLIFIIGDENFEFSISNGREKKKKLDFEYLKKCLLKFSWTRKMFLQIVSINDDRSKIYSKRTNSEEFIEIGCEYFVNQVDDEVLDMLIKIEKTSKKPEVVEEICKKFFKIFYKPRKLIKVVHQGGLMDCQQNDLAATSNGVCKMEWEDGKIVNEQTRPRTQEIVIKSEPKWEEDLDEWNQPNNREIVPNNEIKSEEIVKIEHEMKSEALAECEEIPEDEILEHVKDEKFVVISDKIKSGRSWFLKNMKNKLKQNFESHSISYVDLKQFVQEFKAQITELEFTAFMTEKILKTKTKFEAEIFKKLYKNGKVCFIFDGFDEIVPECAEIVTKLFKSFDQNSGNQLWIATRDGFVIDLREKLELNVVYKLDNFTAKPRAELIESCQEFLLSEVKLNKSLEYHESLWRILRENFETTEIVNIISNTDEHGNSLLQVAAKANTNDAMELIWQNIKEFLTKVGAGRLINYLKSANNDGENILHTLFKLKDEKKFKFLCSEFAKIYFGLSNLNLEDFKELWTQKSFANDENILHLASNWNIPEIHETLWKLLLKSFENRAELTKLILQLNKNGKNFIHNLIINDNLMILEFSFQKLQENLNEAQFEEVLKSDIFPGKNLLHLAATESKNFKVHKFLWNIFKNFYKSEAKLLNLIQEVDMYSRNILYKVAESSTVEIFLFLIDKLKQVANQRKIKRILKNLSILSQNILQAAAGYNKCVQLHKYLWVIIETNFKPQEILDMINHKNQFGYNLLQISVENNTKEVAEQTWKMVKVYFKDPSSCEFLEYLNSVNNQDNSFLQILWKSNDPEKLKYFWNDLILLLQDGPQQFKDLLSKEASKNNENILHVAAVCDNIDYHEALWELLVETYGNKDELKELIQQVNDNGNNFIFSLITNENADVLEFVFSKIKEIFGSSQYQELLKSKDANWNRNLLHQAATASKNIKIHQVLWKIFREFCQSNDEFLEVLKEVDSQSNNVLHLTACFGSKEVLEFTISELEKIANIEDIKKFLSILGQSKKNIIQSAVRQNKSLELHQHLWTIVQKYFNSFEVIKMIQQTDKYKNNVLLTAVGFNTTEIIEFTWNEVRKYFIKIEGTSSVVPQDLKEFMMQKDRNGNNLPHFAVIRDSADIIEFTFKKLKDDFSPEVYQEFLHSKGYWDRNLIQQAACQSQNIKTHQILWQIISDYCNSDDKILKILKEIDKDNNNVFHVAASFASADVLEFWINKLEGIASLEEIRILLNRLGIGGRNLLQTAARQNKSLETQRNLWKVMKKYFYSSEILRMISHSDVIKNNLLMILVQKSTVEVSDFIFQEINSILSIHEKIGLVECLKSFNNNGHNVIHMLIVHKCNKMLRLFWKELETFHESQNLFHEFKQLASNKTSESGQNVLQLAAYSDDIEFHEALWELILNTFWLPQELTDLIFLRNKYGNNFAHVTVVFGTAEVIELTFGKFKELLSDEQYQHVLEFKGYLRRNLLQLAAWATEGIKSHQILWKIFQDFYKSDEELLKIVKEVDEEGNNFFHVAACSMKGDVFQFVIQELKDIASGNEIRRILSTLGHKNQNLLQLAVGHNKCIKFHQNLWKIIQKYFEAPRIVNMIKHLDCHEDNLIVKAIKMDTKDISELTLNKINELLTINDNEGFIKHLKNVNKNGESILHVLVKDKNPKTLKLFWQTLKCFLTNKCNQNNFKDLISHSNLDWGENVLHVAAYSNDIEFHKTLWELLLNTFENREELKQLIMQKNNFGNNVAKVIFILPSTDIIEFIFKKFKENFSEEQYQEIKTSLELEC